MNKSKFFMALLSTLIVGKAIASGFDMGKAIDTAVLGVPKLLPEIAEKSIQGLSLVLGNIEELNLAIKKLNTTRLQIATARKEKKPLPKPSKADILAIRDIFKIMVVGFLGTEKKPGIANSLAEYAVDVVGAGLGITSKTGEAKENIKMLSTLLIQSLQLIDMLLPLLPEDSSAQNKE